MNRREVEIQIYFEIAMAIGTSLDLRKMLRTALSAYLRKLSCATGAVLELRHADGNYHYVPLLSIPGNTIRNPVYTVILKQLPARLNDQELQGFLQSLPLSGSVNNKHYFCFTLLPDFGLLLLIRSGQPLDARILHSLRQLNKKLADSCLSSRRNEQIETINVRLGHEIAQRRIAEAKLQATLDSLEQQVAERTRDLRASKQQYKAIFDNIRDIFFSLALDGRIVEISPSVESTLHYARSRLLGHSVCDLGFPREKMEAIIEQIRMGGSVKDYPLAIRARDRVLHHFSMNAVITEGGGEEPPRIVGSLRDITLQHLTEQSRKTLEEQLQNSRKMEALGLLAGGVAHDLNNVLSGIVSYPDLLLSLIDNESRLRHPLTVIRDSGEKAAAIVQDLLTMARRGVVRKEVINLNRIIADYLASPEHRKLLSSHGDLSIVTDLQTELLNLEGSALHLKNAIMNLVLNSAEAGANRIILATENLYLEKNGASGAAVPAGEYVVLRVTDDGSGISREDQQRIFEPFYTKKVMGKSGTGLGMSVVWGTVQDHGGHITIDSEPYKTTTFRLTFPGSRKTPIPEEPGESGGRFLGNGESVLIVDDSIHQRQIAAAVLKALNYTVLTTESGEQALQLLQENVPLPDIILLDMIMEPGMDGLDTYRLIRDRYPDLKVIIASGYSETDRVKEALRLGALTYIRKPYLLNTIGAALRQALMRPRNP